MSQLQPPAPPIVRRLVVGVPLAGALAAGAFVLGLLAGQQVGGQEQAACTAAGRLWTAYGNTHTCTDPGPLGRLLLGGH